jgi:protein associated with RNAse G/E
MELAIKIRGIYSTALTQFAIENSFSIVEPSKEIRERFKNYKKFDSKVPFNIEIKDLEDRQGILLRGEEKLLKQLAYYIQSVFFDAIIREMKDDGHLYIVIEFPYLSKSILDEFRNKVVPTVPNHHRLRIISSEYVDLMERLELSNHPEKREIVGKNLEEKFIWERFEKGKEVSIEHVKVDGRIIFLSEGEVIEKNRNEKRLILKRSKFKGRQSYDGLNIPKEPGDYAITELKEGEWFYKHTYYRKNGTLLGEYYNLNTPIEIYPDKIRYVDLEVDVVKWPHGKVEILEEDLLEKRVKDGFINSELSKKIKKISETLKDMLLK